MQPRTISQSLAVCLLTASQLICPSFALVNNTNDLDDNQSAKLSTDKTVKHRSIVLTPKWSLPFQGQLSNVEDNAAKLSAANGLNLFKPKKVQVLSLTPPETLNSNLIADATIPDISTTYDTAKQNGKFIAGEVSVWDGPFDGDRIVNHLLESHFENSTEGKKLDEQVKRHAGLGHRAMAVTKDGCEELLGYQGFGPSMRGGKLLLNSPDMVIRNVAWAEYVRQRYIDKIHAQVVSCLMQLAEGIGDSENEHGAKAIASAKEELIALVGNEEADRAVAALTTWLNNIKISYAVFTQTPWITSERNKKLETVLSAAVARDPVINEVTKRIIKYARPGKVKLASSQVIQTTLNAVTIFSPMVVPSISAAAVQVAFKLSTGGTEQNKLERELLLDKRVQSRLKVLTQETALALDNYRFALVTKNPPLLAFSQEVLENLGGGPKVLTLLSSADKPVQDYDSTNKVVPEIKDGKKETQAASSKAGFVVKTIGQMAVSDFKNYDD